jgi:hypothetical protein
VDPAQFQHGLALGGLHGEGYLFLL